MSTVGQLVKEFPTGVDGDVRNEWNDAIKASMACIEACTACVESCLSEPDVAAHVPCIRASLDCEAVNRAAVGILQRRETAETTAIRSILETSVAFAEQCAQACEQHASMSDACRRCAEACRVDIDACRDILSWL